MRLCEDDYMALLCDEAHCATPSDSARLQRSMQYALNRQAKPGVEERLFVHCGYTGLSLQWFREQALPMLSQFRATFFKLTDQDSAWERIFNMRHQFASKDCVVIDATDVAISHELLFRIHALTFLRQIAVHIIANNVDHAGVTPYCVIRWGQRR